MAISVGAGLVVVLVGGQLLVPAIATIGPAHRLAKHGRVLSARVSAFPWVELLWQHADSVTARMADFNAQPEELDQLLQQAEGIGKLDISVGVVHTGLLTLRDVSFSKHGEEMVGVGRLELDDLAKRAADRPIAHAGSEQRRPARAAGQRKRTGCQCSGGLRRSG